MARRQRKRSSKKRGFLGPSWLRSNDFAGGVVGPGDKTYWYRGNLQVPKDRDFWLIGAELQCIAEPANGQQGALGGATVQLDVHNPPNSSVEKNAFWSSGPIVIGTIPFRKYFKFRGAVPFPGPTLSTQPILLIENICQRKEDTGSIRYVLRLDFRISPEQFVNTCPTILTPVSNEIDSPATST